MSQQLRISAFESINPANGLRNTFYLLVFMLRPPAEFLVKMK
jgi:hypothetical protein